MTGTLVGRRVTATAAGVLAALALAACSGDSAAAPAELPPISSASPSVAPSVAPTPASTPTATASTSPGAFDEATQASAEAFVQTWWDALNGVLVGESPGRVRELYVDECRFCGELYKNATEFAESGARLVGGQQRVDSISFDTNNGAVALVNSTMTTAPGTLYGADGSVQEKLSGAPQVRFVFNLVRQEDGWRIQDILNLGETQ